MGYLAKLLALSVLIALYSCVSCAPQSLPRLLTVVPAKLAENRPIIIYLPESKPYYVPSLNYYAPQPYQLQPQHFQQQTYPYTYGISQLPPLPYPYPYPYPYNPSYFYQQQQQQQQQQQAGPPYIIILNSTNRNDHDIVDTNKNSNNHNNNNMSANNKNDNNNKNSVNNNNKSQQRSQQNHNNDDNSSLLNRNVELRIPLPRLSSNINSSTTSNDGKINTNLKTVYSDKNAEASKIEKQ